MKLTALALIGTVLSILHFPAQSAAADGYAPVDPASLSTVSAESLVLASYISIFTIFSIYIIHLVLRHRANAHKLKQLRDSLR